MAAAAACSPARREAPMPRSTAPSSGNFALHVEGLLVGGAQRRRDAVHRQLHLAPLQPFLQFGLGVLGGRGHGGIDLDVLEQAAHQRLGGGVAGVQVHGADHGLQRIGQDRGPPAAAGARLALAQPNDVRQAQADGELVQGFLLDQVGAHARQVAFGQGLQAVVQQRGNGQVEHGIAQEFQPLVVVGREAAVRQRPRQQLRVGELVLQARLQCDEPAIHACLDYRVFLDCPAYFSSR